MEATGTYSRNRFKFKRKIDGISSGGTKNTIFESVRKGRKMKTKLPDFKWGSAIFDYYLDW